MLVAILSRADLRAADLGGADLGGANLRDADLSGADLRDAKLSSADLSGAILNSADLTKANLIGANLIGAKLSLANLIGADLSLAKLSLAKLSGAFLIRTDLSGADLGFADLRYADLNGADLNGADLRGADLGGANLRYAKLSGTQLAYAGLGYTIFTHCRTLHEAQGLAEVGHSGPSSLDAATLRAGVAHLPDVFLQGVGYSLDEIETLRALYGTTFRYYSCFIAYRHTDIAFAERLRNDLTANNVTCWKVNLKRKRIEDWRVQINEALRLHDKVILVCSEQSLVPPAIIEEILKAIKLQETGGNKKLFPIRLDDFIFSDVMKEIGKEQTATGEWPANWLAKVRAFHIPDFSGWKKHDAYKRELERLLRDLKSPASR